MSHRVSTLLVASALALAAQPVIAQAMPAESGKGKEGTSQGSPGQTNPNAATSGNANGNGTATANEPAPGQVKKQEAAEPSAPATGNANGHETAPGQVTKQQGAEPSAPAADPELPADVAPPVLGTSVVLGPQTGTVRVRKPGSEEFVTLSDAESLPVGTVIDATAGAVTLSSAVPGGTQTGTFNGGRFRVRQNLAGDGMTDIVLTGGRFAGCRRKPAARGPVAVASAASRKKRKAVRRLWAKDDGGRFRTHGRHSVASVRGTSWVTEDRCDGTLTRVTDGIVDVRDRRRGKVTRVTAGHHILVRAPHRAH